MFVCFCLFVCMLCVWVGTILQITTDYVSCLLPARLYSFVGLYSWFIYNSHSRCDGGAIMFVKTLFLCLRWRDACLNLENVSHHLHWNRNSKNWYTCRASPTLCLSNVLFVEAFHMVICQWVTVIVFGHDFRQNIVSLIRAFKLPFTTYSIPMN